MQHSTIVPSFSVVREDSGALLKSERVQRFRTKKALLMRTIMHVNEADQMLPIIHGLKDLFCLSRGYSTAVAF